MSVRVVKLPNRRRDEMKDCNKCVHKRRWLSMRKQVNDIRNSLWRPTIQSECWDNAKKLMDNIVHKIK